MTFPEVWFTPDHARALGISTDGLPVNLADPVACAEWFANVKQEDKPSINRQFFGENYNWVDYFRAVGRLIAAAQAGTLKLPELKPKVHEFGGVRFEEAGPKRQINPGEWYTADGNPYCASGPSTCTYIPLRPILPPPRQELKVGDRLTGEICGHKFERVQVWDLGRWDVVILEDAVRTLHHVARSTIDAAVAAGTLEVERG